MKHQHCALTALASIIIASSAFGWETTPDFGSPDSLAIRSDNAIFVTGTSTRRGEEQVAARIDPDSGKTMWRRTIAAGSVLDSALTPSGDLVTAGHRDVDQAERRFFVARLDGETGAILWTFDIESTSGFGGNALSVATDSNGDVVAAGSADALEALTIKLNGVTGAEIWRSIEGRNSTLRLRIDGNDNPIVTSRADPDANQGVVIKLDGGSGATISATTMPALANLIATLANGNAIATTINTTINGQDGTVYELDLDTATILWSVPIDIRPFSGAVTSNGDIVVAGSRKSTNSNQFNVAKITGTPIGNPTPILWQMEFGDPALSDLARKVTLDATGDVYVAGSLSPPVGRTDAFFAKLDGTTGSVIWSDSVNGRRDNSEGSGDAAVDLSLHPSGDLIVLAEVENNEDLDRSHWTVLRRDSATAADVLSGRSLTLRERNGELKARVTIKDNVGVDARPDADPSLSGATVTFENPGSGESVAVQVPAGADWRATRTNKVTSYRYSGPGPCKRVSLSSKGHLKLSCKVPAVGLTLDEPTQNEIQVSVRVGNGSGAQLYCARFGGIIRVDQPGTFRALKAPANTCP